MNIKKIAAAAVKTGRLQIFNRTDAEGTVEQWILVGGAAYPLGFMPYLEPEHLKNVFSITDKQAETLIIGGTEAPDLDLSDACEGDLYAEPDLMSVKYNGNDLLPLYVRDEEKTYFLKKALLDPVLTADGNESFYLRRGHVPIFVIKWGLFIRGAVSPMIMGENYFKNTMQRMAATMY